MRTFAERSKTSGSTLPGNFPVTSRTLFFQPKLTINAPQDQYEREADAVAESVTRMPSASVQARPMPISGVQRKCSQCEEDAHLQRKEMGGDSAGANKEFEDYVGGLPGRGASLPREVRSHFEPRFGHDFSQVKVHTDATAARSAQSINAHAYTFGNNIVFNSGRFSPATDSGSKLLAHELTHVVQQSGMVQPKLIQRFGPEDEPFGRDPLAVQPGGPFDVGDNIYTFQFGGDGWEACGPIPNAATGSDNACISFDSLDDLRNWGRRQGVTLPQVHCGPGQLPNLMLGSCCPPGRVPRGVTCVEQGSFPPPVRCTPPAITIGNRCLTLPTPPRAPVPEGPQPAPGSSGLAIHFTIGVLDDFNIDEHGINSGQQPAWTDIRRRIHQFMERCPESFMVVTGYADHPGNDQHNVDLGQRRADFVKLGLQISLLDIPSTRPVFILSRSEGRSNPADPTAGTGYSARNRRVEIQMFSVCPSPPRLTPPQIGPRLR
ncbi:MAG TPA: DUF4157 domain-containing protein [Pyrinomonadaceae bacterium]|nr:DUF4157 domain-containing protein [Pyrinomonadaceae bacterium]